MSRPFFIKTDSNSFLTGSGLTLGHLKIYLRFKFPNYREAGRVAGLSVERVRQIVTGKYLPKKPEIIQRMASGWGINAIVLTQMFEEYREGVE